MKRIYKKQLQSLAAVTYSRIYLAKRHFRKVDKDEHVPIWKCHKVNAQYPVFTWQEVLILQSRAKNKYITNSKMLPISRSIKYLLGTKRKHLLFCQTKQETKYTWLTKWNVCSFHCRVSSQAMSQSLKWAWEYCSREQYSSWRSQLVAHNYCNTAFSFSRLAFAVRNTRQFRVEY